MPSKRPRSGDDQRYNTSEKGKERQRRYTKSEKGKARQRKARKKKYEEDKAAGICVKIGCHEPADAGIYCADHLRYVSETGADRNFSKGGG